MPPLSAVYFDAHDLFYDLSQWRTWICQTLSRMDIDTDRLGMDLNPYAVKPLAEFWDELSTFLKLNGLSEGQSLEFIHAARYSYQSLITSTRGLPEAQRAVQQFRNSGMSICVATRWVGTVSFEDFLGQIGFREPIDSIAICEIANAGFDAEQLRNRLLPQSVDCLENSAYVTCSRENLVAAKDLGFGLVAYVPAVDSPKLFGTQVDGNFPAFNRLLDFVLHCTQKTPSRRVA